MTKPSTEALGKDVEAIQEVLRVLFPSMTDDELVRAVLNLSGYLDEVSTFHNSLVSDPERYAQFAELTVSQTQVTVKEGLDGLNHPDSSIHA